MKSSKSKSLYHHLVCETHGVLGVQYGAIQQWAHTIVMHHLQTQFWGSEYRSLLFRPKTTR